MVKGTYLANNHCVIVVEAGQSRSSGSSSVNGVRSGGIFPAGSNGMYCELVLQGNDQDNWTVSVATDKDEVKRVEVIFVAGTGGGGL